MKTSDLVERLRQASIFDSWPAALLAEAADEIEKLRKDVQVCRNAMPLHIAKVLYEGEG